jgi:D-alanyl-D-alanine carboxypeptidase
MRVAVNVNTSGLMTGFCALLLAAIWLAAPAAAYPSDASLRASLQRDVNQYLSARSKIEHISAISLSISLHSQSENINLTAGRTQYGGGGTPVTPKNLWQTGSQTKAFTAATILQLEAERKLTIDQTLGRWLPQYPAWKNLTIRRLLNMTSGIPDYAAAPAMLADYAKNPKRSFAVAELIAYVYPDNPHAPAPTTGWDYSNTNYLLVELIIERATGHSYASEIERRFLRSNVGLNDTYYAATQYPRAVIDRMVSGYFVSHDAEAAPLAPLLGTDTRDDSVSWLRASGGIVSTPEDLTRWVRALYTGTMLAPTQRAELLSLVSQKTGRPIAKTTSPSDPRGFGLGVAQLTHPATGTVWFYEGETIGYRMVYVYFPRQDAVLAFGLNSLPDSKQDQSGKLIDTIYQTLHAARRL